MSLAHVARMRRLAAAVVAALVLCLAASSAASGASDKGSITPCLALAADGSPIYPTMTFPPAGKEMFAAFELPADSKAQKLTSRWVAVDVGDAAPANTKMAEKELELKGAKSGSLHYTQDKPLPVGKYKLEVRADGKHWQTVDLTVAAPAQAVERDKDKPLFDLPEGKSIEYTMVMTPGPGVKLELPNATPDDKGLIRADVSERIGKADENGTPVDTLINGQPVVTGWIKSDSSGVYVTQQKTGDKIEKSEPPRPMALLPLEYGKEWTYKRQGMGDGKARAYGPVPVNGPDGTAAPGWVVVEREIVGYGSPGVPGASGEVTLERHFLPGFGLVREVRVQTIENRLNSRSDLTLKTNTAFVVMPNAEMKGRLGRMVFKFPEGSKCDNTRIAVLKGGSKAKDKPIQAGYGNQSYEVMPGTYAVVVAGKLVDGGEVKSKNETFPQVGALRLQVGNDTQVKLLDSDGKTEIYAGYGAADVGLPVGTYKVSVSGQTEDVKIEAGKVTEF